MNFYLGTHRAHWLSDSGVPLFVSHRLLAARRSLPRAASAWAVDSGGFSELSLYGEWRTTPEEYARALRRYQDEIGRLDWAAPQDWMCEPFMLERTGLSVSEHQRRTVENLLTLRQLGARVIPVLQGWTPDDYTRCWEMYERAGVSLESEPVVGVGSVCRRQGSGQITEVMARLQPLRLHGFGVKVAGLRRYGCFLTSADSMAWSATARRGGRMLDGCTHKTCTNCRAWALTWRSRVMRQLEREQMALRFAA